MQDNPHILADESEAQSAKEEYGLSQELVQEVRRALEEDEVPNIRGLLLELHASDLAELISQLSLEQRHAIIDILAENFDPEILTHAGAEVREELMEYLGAGKAAEAIAKLDTDDAVHVIEDLSKEDQQEILEAIPQEAREELMEGLAYPESSAGRLMRRDLVSVPEFWSVGDAIDYLRNNRDTLPEDFYVIYVVNPKFQPVGSLLLSRVMQCRRVTKVRDIMYSELRILETAMDQEEVARIFRKYGLVEAPVVSERGKLVGSITVDDVVDVIQEEGEEDLLRLGGVSHQDFHAPIFDAVQHRFVWLFVNLLTAILASFVISRFEEAITQLVTLAVLMPIIASMGGNAGIQTVTVIVRAIATRDLTFANLRNTIRKEVIIGSINGLLLALVTGIGIAVIFGQPKLALIFAVAMMINMLVAGLAGVLYPVLFAKLRIDPAITSGVFLTMVTDVTGFLAFLGLATWWL